MRVCGRVERRARLVTFEDIAIDAKEPDMTLDGGEIRGIGPRYIATGSGSDCCPSTNADPVVALVVREDSPSPCSRSLLSPCDLTRPISFRRLIISCRAQLTVAFIFLHSLHTPAHHVVLLIRRSPQRRAISSHRLVSPNRFFFYGLM